MGLPLNLDRENRIGREQVKAKPENGLVLVSIDQIENRTGENL